MCCFVLNSFFASLSPYLNLSEIKIGLSHGSNLDVWAQTKNFESLAKSFKNRSIFKYMPQICTNILIKKILKTQYHGYLKSKAVMFFPFGFNTTGDEVLQQLTLSGVKFITRYDISFQPLIQESRSFKPPTPKICLFSGVRFLYKTFPDGNRGYNKGNDIIIEGIAKYFSKNPNIEVHFVEKGEDVHHAKELCKKFGIENIVIWHKEMKCKELLSLYRNSDICFDQVGEHWISAIGGYSLWLGKPLIANADSAVKSGVWPSDNPVCSASTSDEICHWLVQLEDIEFRSAVSAQSKDFVEKYMGPNLAINALFEMV